MLHRETVAPSTWTLLKKLQSEPLLKSFRLVGGTALALHIGHRISVDLDLFTNECFKEDILSSFLIKHYGMELEMIDKCTVKGEIDGVQIDCIAHEYPWIGDGIEEAGVTLAGLEDIAAMKLNAIAGNDTRIKDFIDVAYISQRMSLNQMLAAYEKKYSVNAIIPLKALTYWDGINMNEPIKILSPSTFRWKDIAKRLSLIVKNPELTDIK